jgi:UDP-N-acetylmuramate dehydrogenase
LPKQKLITNYVCARRHNPPFHFLLPAVIDPYLHIINNFPQTLQNQPLAPLTTMGIGGPADLYFKLTDPAQLPYLAEAAAKHEIPITILAGGSNIIFADEGFRGLVIHVASRHIAMDNDETIVADAGTLLSQIIQFALKNSLTGMEKMTALPGTIGGAVRGNAGAFGLETKDIFQKALLYSPTRGLREEQKPYFNFAYRSSTIKTSDDIILKVWLKLKRATPEVAKKALEESLDIVKNRISKQPKGKCSGSFFKNPVPPDYTNPQKPETKAAYLLEQSGCKNLQVGDAKVSPLHANWIMNLGHATQKDVLTLAEEMSTRVKAKYGINLEKEVQFIGSRGPLSA